MAVQYNTRRSEAFHYPGPLSLSLPPVTSAEDRQYAVQRLGPEHREAVLEHLREFFFRDEPLNIASGLALEEDLSPAEEYAVGSLGQRLSVGAVAPDGTLVGVCINAGISREEEEEALRDWEARADDDLPDDAAPGAAAKFWPIKRVLERCAAESNVFALHPEEPRLLDLCVISVHSKWRGVGMAKRLVQATRDLARGEGYRLLRVTCTSHFSALAVSRLGFHCVHRLDYQDARDGRGRQLLRPAPPHRAATVYLQLI